jgi:LPXTG-site transpeptidase (sortase) family protein
MNMKAAKLLIAFALLIAFLALGRGLIFAPNGDSGLRLGVQANSSESSSTTRYPVKLIIPKLDINADIQHVGVTKKGNMSAPDNYTDVSWYKYGTVPGTLGSAVMAGHEDNALSLDGIFKHLEDLEIGDDIYVQNTGGERVHFRVVDKEIYPYNNAPLDRIFDDSSGTFLNLITCAGDWIPEEKTNDKRLVVYTKLVR